VTAIGNEIAVLRLKAQWVTDDCHQRRSRGMGDDVRSTAVGIMMEGGGVITIDGSSCNG
jgi:hypothetical protein